MSVIAAMFLTVSLELPDSEMSSTKRQVTPFLYIGPHPSASTLAGIGINQRTVAKIAIIFQLQWQMNQKTYNFRELFGSLKEKS